MTLTELRYIVAVAQDRHFGKAANRCFITQPALSLAIQKLEEELGVKVFERRKNQIAVTPMGERLVHQAQRVLEEAEQMKVIAAQGKNQLVGPLRFGVIATVGPYILPELVPILHKRARQMPLEIEENLTTNLTAMLKSGRLDVGKEDATGPAHPDKRTGIAAARRTLLSTTSIRCMPGTEPFRHRYLARQFPGDYQADGRVRPGHYRLAL